MRRNGVQPLPSDSAFYPLPIRLQNKESNLDIWSPMTDLDVVQMSFRMSFRSRGISKKQVYCQDADV